MPEQNGWTQVAEAPKGWTRVESKAEEPAKAEGGGLLRTILDLAIGGAKGAGSTVANIGEMAANAGVLPGVRPNAFGSADMRNPAFTKAEEATTASNDTQRVGKGIEAVAEMAIPTGAAVNAIPRTARAATKFQRVATAAKGVPVNVEGPGQVALRIQQLAERGGTEPRVVSKFLRRVTDPKQAPMAFDEGRDFYSNISRLSADEYGRLTAPIQREVGNLRAALNTSLQDSAQTVGKGAEYAGAMKEYAQAAKFNHFRDALMDALKRGALPAGIGGGAALWLGGKARGLAGEMFEE